MKYKILVIDDEEIILTMLKRNLEAEGYNIFTACSAKEGLIPLLRKCTAQKLRL